VYNPVEPARLVAPRPRNHCVELSRSCCTERSRAEGCRSMKKDGLREMGFDILSVARQNSLLDGSRGTGLSICLKCTKPLVRNLSRSVAGYHILLADWQSQSETFTWAIHIEVSVKLTSHLTSQKLPLSFVNITHSHSHSHLCSKQFFLLYLNIKSTCLHK